MKICKQCGVVITGQGKYFCSMKCLGESRKIYYKWKISKYMEK